MDVDIVVDVRLHAVSRRRGFSKRALGELLRCHGIEYVHEPALGNPPDNRLGFRQSANRERARARYRTLVAGGGEAALGRVTDLARDRHVALLCVEREPATCHRAVLLELLSDVDAYRRDGGETERESGEVE